ncbi:Fasciclin-like arabinogalactan protein 9 [Forsythia ovata]|uniref:Fasciclin-like arabinogalactan protein 9 n=1 Tax=Forsythia ovata TaxID=205694 RepID=A0ABD1R4J4_9LAMI
MNKDITNEEAIAAPYHIFRNVTQPAPAPSGPINITGILEKAGQYTTFIRLLNQTQAGNQINSQLNSSNEGMTVFAPTDNAFLNLPSGTLNHLSPQQQVQLVQYHVLPKYYTLENLQTVSNPVRTQATGQDGGLFGLNFTGQGNQVNVSTGIVDIPIYNALRKDFPLAVYQVDKVLLPLEFYQAKAPAASPPASNGTKSDTGDKKTPDAPSPANGSGKMSMEFGLVSGLWLMLCYLM